MRPADAAANSLTSRSMAVVSRHYKSEAKSVEPWYETKYNAVHLSEERLTAWTHLPANSQLFLPAPNIFIPESFGLRERAAPLPKYPTLVHSTPCVRVWHKLDDTFLKPKANICT